jgi:hypothetical protein
MSLCLQIAREPAGIWPVHGLTNRPVARLPSLAACIDYARRECAEAPATIEFMIDGFHAVAHQQKGWPRRLVVQEVNAPRIAPAEIGAQGRPLFTRCREWVTGRRRRRSAFVCPTPLGQHLTAAAFGSAAEPAALLRPTNCQASAKTLGPYQFALPSVPANANIQVAPALLLSVRPPKYNLGIRKLP